MALKLNAEFMLSNNKCILSMKYLVLSITKRMLDTNHKTYIGKCILSSKNFGHIILHPLDTVLTNKHLRGHAQI